MSVEKAGASNPMTESSPAPVEIVQPGTALHPQDRVPAVAPGPPGRWRGDECDGVSFLVFFLIMVLADSLQLNLPGWSMTWR